MQRNYSIAVLFTKSSHSLRLVCDFWKVKPSEHSFAGFLQSPIQSHPLQYSNTMNPREEDVNNLARELARQLLTGQSSSNVGTEVNGTGI